MATEKAPSTSGKGLHEQTLTVQVTVNMTDAANHSAAVGQHHRGVLQNPMYALDATLA